MLMADALAKRDVVKTFPLEMAGIDEILCATRVKEYLNVSAAL